ncbi:DUF3830 family protein [Botrimarina sp.]|uniref:DUF3830 family protein n=1 Tax=Botrimarina sp. TaxID=2795802 RepID=UPI0032F03129
MSRAKQIRLCFPDEGASASARLLWTEAPATCEAVLSALPARGDSHHAIYSGSECVLLLPEVLRLPKENATSKVRRGQVAFTWMQAGAAYGVEQDFAEVCWFYDLDAEPRMWGGVVEVNIFAEITEPADDFYRVCFRMRREGVKPLLIESAPEEDTP